MLNFSSNQVGIGFMNEKSNFKSEISLVNLISGNLMQVCTLQIQSFTTAKFQAFHYKRFQ